MAKKAPIVRSGIDESKPAVPSISPKRRKDRRTKTEAEIIALERNIRVYVKRTGGFRYNMADEDVEKGKDLLKRDTTWAGRGKNRDKRARTAEDGWDESIHVPSYDNVDHVSNQKKLEK